MHGHMKTVKPMRYQLKPILEASEEPTESSSSNSSSPTSPIQFSHDWNERTSVNTRPLYLVLPIAFFASLSMAVTNPSTLFAYSTLICKDPLACKEHEQEEFSGTFAASTAITNLCGVLVLGLLPYLRRRGRKAPLYFWLGSRAVSVALLMLGVSSKTLEIALWGRIFEGLAKDNILQLCLNAIFVHAPGHSQVSQFFGLSLALFMLGQALGSSIAGMFTDYRTSFVLAIGMFSLCALYLFLAIPQHKLVESTQDDIDNDMTSKTESSRSPSVSSVAAYVVTALQSLFGERALYPAQFTLLLYFGGASYALSAVMVYASLRFQFTVRETGWLISTAASSGSIYLFAILVILKHGCSTKAKEAKTFVWASRKRPAPDFWFGVLSLALFSVAIPCVGLVSQRWELYPIIAVTAMGFSTPTFIRSYAVTLVEDGTQAISNLAFMETTGALVSPLILGAIQSQAGVKLVFGVSSLMVAAGLFCLIGGACWNRFRRRRMTVKSIDSVEYQAL